MGVSHLWELLAPSGKYCSLTTLKNKRLAIDASVWISQLVAGMVDDRGNPIPNAHLKGLFTRQVAFFGIKPVFVFDGGVPALKQRTIAARRRRREDAERNYRKTAEKLLMQRLGLEYVEKQTERKRRGKRKRLEELEEEEMLAFSQLEQSQNEAEKEKGTEEETKEEIERRNDEVEIWELEAQPELEEASLLSALGIDPEVYAALPEELQEEVRQSVHSRQVVLEMREEQSILTGEWDDPILQRHRLNAQLLQSQMSIKHNDPKAAQDFSQQQLQNLVKNGEMWRKIKQTKEEIKHSLSSSNLSTSENRIASDSTREYMLISVDDEAEKEKKNSDTEDYSTSPSKKRRVDKGKEKMENYSSAETFSFSRFFDEEGQAESISGGGVLTAAEGEETEQELQGGGFLIEPSDEEDEVEVQSKLKEKEEKHSERGDKGKEKEVEPEKEKEQEKEAIVFYRKQTSSVSEEKQQDSFQFLEEPVLPPGPNVSPIKARTSIFEQPQKVNEIYGVEEQEESGIDITFDPTKVTTTDIFDFSLFEQSNTNGEEEKAIQKEKRKEQDFLFEDELLAIQLQEEKDDDDELKDRHSSNTELNNATESAPSNAPLEIDTSIDTSIDEIHRQLEMEAILLSQKAKQQGKAIQSVTNEMLSDCQELLQLFGIPYVISPMEAEAQCGYLNANGLVHGVVTEDSDIFLVGGLTVYKKFFSREHLEAYSLGDIKRKLGLDRQKLIELALLLGSDYTEGVKGIGPVHAMEVISTFESLDAFKKWWESPNTDDFPVDEEKEDRENEQGDEKENANGRVGFNERDYKRVSIKLRQLKKRIRLRKDFPSQAVVEAYLHPQVDESLESFEWGKPDLDGLRKFAAHKMGWSEERADELVIPLLKKSVEEAEQEAEKESTTTQKTLDDWFLQIPKKLESVRVHNAIQHLVSNSSNKNTAGTKAKRGRKITATTTTAKKKGSATKKKTTKQTKKKKHSKK